MEAAEEPTSEEGDDEEVAQHLELVSDWPVGGQKLGQVGGVAIDTKSNVVVLHRGNRIWQFG